MSGMLVLFQQHSKVNLYDDYADNHDQTAKIIPVPRKKSSLCEPVLYFLNDCLYDESGRCTENTQSV
jgi:hypothetical protein